MNLQIAKKRLIKLGKKDQKLRFKLSSKAKRKIPYTANEMVIFDSISTKYLIKVLEKFGVPTISVFGREATHYAFLIAQHSVDIEFKKKYLELLIKANTNKQYSSKIAYLEDRINVLEDKPQKYGTQFRYDSELKKLVPQKLQNEEEVDLYRKEAGLSTLEEYSKLMNNL